MLALHPAPIIDVRVANIDTGSAVQDCPVDTASALACVLARDLLPTHIAMSLAQLAWDLGTPVDAAGLKLHVPCSGAL